MFMIEQFVLSFTWWYCWWCYWYFCFCCCGWICIGIELCICTIGRYFICSQPLFVGDLFAIEKKKREKQAYSLSIRKSFLPSHKSIHIWFELYESFCVSCFFLNYDFFLTINLEKKEDRRKNILNKTHKNDSKLMRFNTIKAKSNERDVSSDSEYVHELSVCRFGQIAEISSQKPFQPMLKIDAMISWVFSKIDEKIDTRFLR